MIGQLIGGVATLSGAAGKGGMDELREAVKLAKGLEAAEFDFRELAPAQLRLVAQYFPEVYEAVIPPEAQLVGESALGRGAQESSLGYFQQVQREGLPLLDRLNAEEAARSVQTAEQRGRLAALNQLQAQGQLGGARSQAVLGSGQQAAELARGLGSDLARQSLMRRFEAAQAAGGLGTQIRGQDLQRGMFNADTLNRFNQYVAGVRTGAAADAAAARNQGQLYNIGQRQRIADANKQARYMAQLTDVERQNMLRQQVYTNELAKINAINSALSAKSNAEYAEQASRERAISDIGRGVDSSLSSLGGGFF